MSILINDITSLSDGTLKFDEMDFHFAEYGKKVSKEEVLSLIAYVNRFIFAKYDDWDSIDQNESDRRKTCAVQAIAFCVDAKREGGLELQLVYDLVYNLI